MFPLPRYPIYIISKTRWASRYTSRAFEAMKVPYRIVVEPQEYNDYASVIDKEKILTLPFSNLGKGSIPARNWVWEHAIEEGHERHWIVDDNIRGFYRFQHNDLVKVSDGAIFCAMEDFSDRYENLAMCGPNYYMFVLKRFGGYKPFRPNTRIYSCILLSNDLPHRWRGRYNEDTDLSLRILKDGYCTALFNAFIQDKLTTMTVSGGNTEQLYKNDGRYQMAKSLQEQHPDVTKITQKWGRWQHHVDYRRFKNNELIPKKGTKTSKTPNEYGMRLVET